MEIIDFYENILCDMKNVYFIEHSHLSGEYLRI
jgi:hypothetical protein